MKKERFLPLLAGHVPFNEDRFEIPRIDSRVVHHGGSRHRSRSEILDLIHEYSPQRRVAGKVFHVLHRASRMGGDEIRYDSGTQAVLPSYSFELDAKPLEEFEGRFSHIVQDLVLRVLGSDLEASGGMSEDQLLQVGP